MNDKRILTLSICDKQYTIATDEDEQMIYRAARLVDTLLREINKKLQSNNESKTAVLAALQCALDLTKIQETHAKQRSELDYIVSLISKELTFLA